jgi:hypothetical protein
MSWLLMDFKIEEASPQEIEQLRQVAIPVKFIDAYLGSH